MNETTCLRWAAILGLSGISIGALGAHALEAILTEQQLNSLEVAVRYQMYHAIALLVLGISGKSLRFRWTAHLFAWGSLLFSGSIYLLIAFKHFQWPGSFLGPITPIGGLLLIVGWLMLFPVHKVLPKG